MTAPTSLAQLLESGAALNASAVAIQSGSRTITHADLLARVAAAAAMLRERLPGRDNRIALCAENDAEHLIAYLAILVSGFAWVPLNPANGRMLNAKIAARAQPELVLVDRNSIDSAPELDQTLPLDELCGESREFDPAEVSADDIAAIKFTGGTSGEPKGVLQTHGNMLAVIENMRAFYDFGPRDCNLVVAPLTHGSSHYMVPVLAAGGRHRFPADNSPATIVAALRDNATIAFMPPTLIYKLLRTKDLSPGQFPQLRHLTYSAAPMPADRIVEAQQAFGPRVSSLYGQTEAPLTITALDTAAMQNPTLRCTVGRPCRNSRVRIVDEEGLEAPLDTVGNVEVSGPIVMRGYLDDPPLTQQTLREGWLRTGDVGSLSESGYLTLAGRASEVIISGGFNVYPAEIENVIAEVRGVRECCVYGVEDSYWGERIEAVVVCDEQSAGAEADILQTVRQRLGPVRTPKALHIVGALPRNAVGKVVRRDMPTFIESLMEKSDVESI